MKEAITQHTTTTHTSTHTEARPQGVGTRHNVYKEQKKNNVKTIDKQHNVCYTIHKKEVKKVVITAIVIVVLYAMNVGLDKMFADPLMDTDNTVRVEQCIVVDTDSEVATLQDTQGTQWLVEDDEYNTNDTVTVWLADNGTSTDVTDDYIIREVRE